MGADPKKPVKKRVIRTVCMSLAVAVPIDMTMEMANGSSTGHFLPCISDKGAQSKGPNPHLREYEHIHELANITKRSGRKENLPSP